MGGCTASKIQKDATFSQPSKKPVEMIPGNVTAKITADERSVRTARVIRNVSIFSRYDFSQARMLGTGISGEVVEAVSKNTGRKVAVKTLCSQNLSPRRLEMLLNEVEIYLKLDHPNICKLLEVYEDASAIRLVMELCTGRELYERLAEKKRYSERDAALVTKQMLDALTYCHDHNICHRDLKLENWVYATPAADAPLKLIDFGFSKLFNPGMPMTAMHGTVYYVAPEVLEGSYDLSCDVWSIGVILYMLLSGQPPFAAQQDHEIIAKIRRSEVAFNGPRWSGISQGAKDFVMFMLQRNPARRPSSVEAAKHPWLQAMLADNSHNSEDDSIDISVLENMQSFAKLNAMKRAALGLMAFSLAPAEMDNLEAEFRKIDKSGTGTIRLGELSEVLTKALNLTPAEAKDVFNSIDQTGDNEIHYTEFLAVSLQTKLLAHEKYVRETFQRFDLDNTGFISLDNLRTVLGDTYHGTDVEEILNQVDYKHNGRIDYEEFMRAVVFDGRDPNEDMTIQRKTSKLILRKTLLAQVQGLADLQDGASSFTWGACRNDARFKLNTKVLDDLEDFSTTNSTRQSAANK